MPTHLRFLFVCDRQFAELPGDDPQQRRCDSCVTTVHNLDAMDPRHRLAVLARAAEEHTTVCVSVSVPTESARACRSGAPIDASAEPSTRRGPPIAGRIGPAPLPPVVALAGRVAPARDIVLPPRRGEPGTTTRSFAADLPAVHAGLAALADGFELRADPDADWWQGHEAALGLAIAVAAEPDGEQTAVVVRMTPPAAPAPVASPRVFGDLAVVVLAPLWLLLAFILWLAGAPMAWLLLGPTAIVGLLAAIVGGFLAVTAIGERARRRARDRWIAAWHQRFWPALTARLAAGPGYR